MGFHCRDYQPVWLLRTPICPVFPASKECQGWQLKKKKYKLCIPRYGKIKMSLIASEKLAHSSLLYSLPLGSIFCLSTCAASRRVAGICFSAPRTAIGWQPRKPRKPELGADVQPNKYFLCTSWGQTQWKTQRFVWSGPSNNLIFSSRQHF